MPQVRKGEGEKGVRGTDPIFLETIGSPLPFLAGAVLGVSIPVQGVCRPANPILAPAGLAPANRQDWPLPATAATSSRPRWACPSGAQDWQLPATAQRPPAPAGLAPAGRRIGNYQRPRNVLPPPLGLPQRSAGLATKPSELPRDHTLRTSPHNSRSRTPVSSRLDRPNYS